VDLGKIILSQEGRLMGQGPDAVPDKIDRHKLVEILSVDLLLRHPENIAASHTRTDAFNGIQIGISSPS